MFHCGNMGVLLAAHPYSHKEHVMTSLRQRMTEDMQIRNLAVNTQLSYLQQVSQFARHFKKSPEQLGPEEIRASQVYLTNERKCRQLLGMQTLSQTTSVKDYRQQHQELAGRSLTLCPRCLKGQMAIVESLPPALWRVPFPLDSS
jgi:hypothetical protein